MCLLLAVLMSITLTACSKGNSTKQSAIQEQTTETEGSEIETNESATNETSAQTAEPAKLSGKMRLIELEDRDPSILRGIRIMGNSIGSMEDINGKESSLDDVRCIFLLNEWIELYPDTDAEKGLCVWILQHRDDQDYYNDCKFNDEMPGFVSYCDLPCPADDPEGCWGSFYLNPEDCEAGYYDFVFTYQGKAIAILLTRFYNDGELNEKSGAELEALMHE